MQPKPHTRTYSQVLVRNGGNSYLGRGSYTVGSHEAQAVLDDLKKGAAYLVQDGYRFFAYMFERGRGRHCDTFILLSRAKSPNEARQMMAELPTETILVILGTEFLHPEISN